MLPSLLDHARTRAAAGLAAYDGRGGEAVSVRMTGLLAGTEVATPLGPRPIEDIVARDLVLSREGNYVRVLHIATRRLDAVTLSRQPSARPIAIAAGAFGPGEPSVGLVVAPGQLLAVHGGPKAAERLVNGASVVRLSPGSGVVYVSLGLAPPGDMEIAGLSAIGDRRRPDVAAGVTSHRAASVAAHWPSGRPRAHLEAADHHHVSGWAYDPDRLDVPLPLEVVVDDTPRVICIADLRRPDLEMAGVGTGTCAFDIRFVNPLPVTRPALIEIRRATDGLQLGGAMLLLPPDPAGSGLADTLARVTSAAGEAGRLSVAASLALRSDELATSTRLPPAPSTRKPE